MSDPSAAKTNANAYSADAAPSIAPEPSPTSTPISAPSATPSATTTATTTATTATTSATTSATTAATQSLARRWANWASNLLVSGVIVVVGLVFGREVVQWWRTPADGTAAKVATDAVTPGSDLLDGPAFDGTDGLRTNEPGAGESGARPVHELSFGDLPYAFRHGAVRGDAAAVVAELRRQCAISADSASPPTGAPAPSELRMLEGLRSIRPSDRRRGVWEIYVLPRPLPMAVAVSDNGRSDSSRDETGRATNGEGRNAVAGSPRVLSWAMAFPDMTDGRWTWFTFRPAGGAASGAGVGPIDSDWPAPPEARRSLVIKAEDGAARSAYAGRGTRASWQTHFDDCAERRGWAATDDWLADERTTRRVFHNDRGDRVDVQIGGVSDGQLQAIMTITPR